METEKMILAEEERNVFIQILESEDISLQLKWFYSNELMI